MLGLKAIWIKTKAVLTGYTGAYLERGIIMTKMTILHQLLTLKNNDGLTLKAYKPVRYKTGWQVADHGIETRVLSEAVNAIIAMNGNAGVWYSEGVWYIDHSFRVATKKVAIEIGKKFNQQSILKWANMSLTCL